jgi:hypothetical protein
MGAGGRHDNYGSALAAQPGKSKGGGQTTTRALCSSDITACPLHVLPTPQSRWVDGNRSTGFMKRGLACQAYTWQITIYLIEQDHRSIKLRLGPMLGLKRFRCASITIDGIEFTHRIRKGQFCRQRFSKGFVTLIRFTCQ